LDYSYKTRRLESDRSHALPNLYMLLPATPFHQKFPHANPNWYNPQVSWKNKYKNGDPAQGAKFPLSTTMLVATTDQYHLNNFINKTAWISTIMIKMSEPRKSFKHYFLDLLYYTACHQAGFALTYYSFTKMQRPY